jgi:PHD/YefM family antitoxin component YafN of YafNO toxin-antitoxin module
MEVNPMVTLHAQIIKKNGKKDYVVLPYEEFLKVQEELEDYDDLRSLREAKELEKDAPTIGMAELKKKIRRRTSRSTGRARKLRAG